MFRFMFANKYFERNQNSEIHVMKSSLFFRKITDEAIIKDGKLYNCINRRDENPFGSYKSMTGNGAEADNQKEWLKLFSEGNDDKYVHNSRFLKCV